MKTWRPNTLAEVARRIADGEDTFDRALSEFLDTFYVWLREGQCATAQSAIADEPIPLADPVLNAVLGAVGEHLARRWGLSVPTWTGHPSRFLKRPHFTTPLEGFKALCLAESPASFRRRLIFTEAEPLRRARFPRAPGGRALEAHEIQPGIPVQKVRPRPTHSQ